MIIQTASQMAQIHAAAFAQERSWSEQEFRALLETRGVYLIGADMGFALVRIVADEAEILTIAVHPDAQGKGMGARIMQQAMHCSASHGAASMFLEVAADNHAAKALYAKCGFVVTGTRRAYYARKDGTSVDALLMTAPLTLRHDAISHV